MRTPATGNTAVHPLAQLLPALADAALGEWTKNALCLQADPETFFPPKGNPGTKAKQICAGCPVRGECLAYAIDADEEFGIWGGMNRAERLKAREAIQARKEASRPASRETA